MAISRRAFLSRTAATALAVAGGVLLSPAGSVTPAGPPPVPAGPSWPAPTTP